MKRQAGFSLIEILVVLILVGIIAAIAVPSLLNSRRSSNEGVAIANLRTIQVAQASFMSTAGGALRYGSLQELVDNGVLDSTFGGGSPVKNQYTFTASAKTGTPMGYCAKATSSVAGQKTFGTNQTAVLYQATAAGDITCASGVLTTQGTATVVAQ